MVDDLVPIARLRIKVSRWRRQAFTLIDSEILQSCCPSQSRSPNIYQTSYQRLDLLPFGHS